MNQTRATEPNPQILPWSEERELVNRCKNGDLEAFDRFVSLYQDSVYGLGFRLMGSHDDASDLAQEVFIVCFRKIGQFRGDSRVRTWLYRITVNLAKNAWKRRDRRAHSSTLSMDDSPGDDGVNPLSELPSNDAGPRKRAEDREMSEAMWRSLEKLSPEHREALVLRCIEDMSYEEIAEATESALGTVKSRINRAREEMRRLMGDFLE